MIAKTDIDKIEISTCKIKDKKLEISVKSTDIELQQILYYQNGDIKKSAKID